MSVNPWCVVFAFMAGVLIERWLSGLRRRRLSAEGIRKLESGEYGERLREKWEKIKKERQ